MFVEEIGVGAAGVEEVFAEAGGRFCVTTGLACTMILPCAGGPSRDRDAPFGGGGDADLTTFTLFDAAPGALMAANLLEAEYTEAKVGRRVELTWQKLNDDFELPQFRLAKE